MAKSNWGITSGFIGKLGNVVGFNWKGINVMRAHTQNGSKSSTLNQQIHRLRFAIINHVLSDLYEGIYVGYRRAARDGKTTQNGLFVKENMCNVLGDSLDNLTLDYENLQITLGKLNGVEFGEATVSDNTLCVTIADDNFTSRRVSAVDQVYLVAYCPELRDAKCAMVGTRTTASALTLSLPAKWNGKTVYAYGFTLGASSFNNDMASPTTFLGSFGSTEASNGSSGSGSVTPGISETPTVETPVIRGTTPFEESNNDEGGGFNTGE